MDQVACLYEPYVLGAMAGQTVQIRNSDPLMHNVNFAGTLSIRRQMGERAGVGRGGQHNRRA